MKANAMLFTLCMAAMGTHAYAVNEVDKASKSKDDTKSENVKEEAPAVQQADPTAKKGLFIGGYGEVALSRNYYSDSPYKYSSAKNHWNEKHGRFDIPHAVIYLGYNFGKGWTMSSEIEFEHGGTGGAYEKEFEEGGEWENETEKGGEVELEQFWIQKSFFPELNVRVGHIVVPIGLTNAHHEPLNFFTVYRPEGEANLFPCTWHQTGISIWGMAKDWRYEAQLIAGLNSYGFSKEHWIQGGASSPFEFEPANKLAVAARVDNYSIKGLRMGVSGYYGHSVNNTYNVEQGSRQENKGAVVVGTFDFTYDDHNWIVRGNFDYSHLGDAYDISWLNQNQNNLSPFGKNHVGDRAVAYGMEAGYDIFSQINKMRDSDQKLYIFGRYEYYDSYNPAKDATGAKNRDYPWTEVKRMAVGVNYCPIPQIVVKGEFSKRFLRPGYKDEPSISFGVAYAGFFTK